ncbi:MAG: hypothetical protein ABSG80_08470 [Verrucomicrobiota bacterium]|jgi:hypothetical protein
MLDCACQGRPNKNEALRAGFSFCVSTLTVLAEPGHGWLGRRAGISNRRFLQAHSTASCAQDGIQADGGKFWNTISRFMVDNCIYNATIGNMPFIQFPFIEVPEELHKLVGEPTKPPRP